MHAVGVGNLAQSLKADPVRKRSSQMAANAWAKVPRQRPGTLALSRRVEATEFAKSSIGRIAVWALNMKPLPAHRTCLSVERRCTGSSLRRDGGRGQTDGDNCSCRCRGSNPILVKSSRKYHRGSARCGRDRLAQLCACPSWLLTSLLRC